MSYFVRKGFDYKLAFHCAPTIAGIKPANLIALTAAEYAVAGKEAHTLAQEGIFLHKLWGKGDKVSLLVYCKRLLEQQLHIPENREFLRTFGYSRGLSFSAMLERLNKRLRCSGVYPHEIGIFLGYPLEDVQAFISTGLPVLWVLEGIHKSSGSYQAIHPLRPNTELLLFAGYGGSKNTYYQLWR